MQLLIEVEAALSDEAALLHFRREQSSFLYVPEPGLSDALQRPRLVTF